jgi:nucleotide-binding universal stress UspA family protein
MKIVVGVDGSEPSLRAVAWCAKYGAALGAEVIAAHAVEVPVYPTAAGFFPMPAYTPPDLEHLRKVVAEEWCAPLTAAGVPFRAEVREGYPANVIKDLAASESADLVAVGRRGLGGFGELLLGSTSHHLSHHVPCALVIVP